MGKRNKIIETQNKKIDVAGLNDKVSQTMSADPLQTSKESLNSSDTIAEDSIESKLIEISSNWTIAEQLADISGRSLQMARYPKSIRWLAKLAGRILLHLNKVITNPLKDYNLRLIQGLRALTDTLSRLQTQIDILENIISYQQRRISLLDRYLENRHPLDKSNEDRSSGSRAEKEQNLAASDVYMENAIFFDHLYKSFEGQFRGGRDEIKKRLSVYLPLVKEVRAGSDTRPILDLGCGRGEWLELLKENNLKSTGIDLNQTFIEQCRENDLEVEKNEAVRHLHHLPENSLGAVTAYHLIEHLPFQVITILMDEALRVLKPGGIAIFETPNPQNLIVGACNFWSDPTHLKPLFPDTQKFLMQFRGFTKVRLIYLHPHDDDQRLPENEAPELAQQLNALLTCARDYAVIGYKYTA